MNYFVLEKAKAVSTRMAPYGVALRDSIAANGPSMGYEAEVASIAVMDGDKLLMGKRRDSGRWTLPGGHLEPGEAPHAGALRELREETGIEAHAVSSLGCQGVVTHTGKTILVHAFHLTAAPNTTTRLDPDQEVEKWEWIDTKNGLPPEVESNLHSSRNICLYKLGIQKSDSQSAENSLFVVDAEAEILSPVRKSEGEKSLQASEIDARLALLARDRGTTVEEILKRVEKGRSLGGPGSNGGHVVRYTRSGKPVYAATEERINKYKKKKPKVVDSLIGQAKAALHYVIGEPVKKGDEPMLFITEPSFYVVDLFRSMMGQERPGHKYLRRYKDPHGDGWVYVYHEGEQHGRALPQEAYGHLKTMADLGHQHAQNLISGTRDHNEDELKMLREMARRGHAGAKGQLQKYGIDHEAEERKRKERESAKAEEAILGERRQREAEEKARRASNPLTKELSGAELGKLHAAIRIMVNDKIFGYLGQHTTSPYYQRAQEHRLSTDAIMQPVMEKKSVAGALEALHESLKRVDQAHAGLPESQNSEARRHGGYGNLAYNAAVNGLHREGFLPDEAMSGHVRNSSNQTGALRLDTERLAEPARRHHERVAAERQQRAEREERERREASEREERERREMEEATERHRESIDAMSSYYGHTLSPQNQIKLARGIQKIFGADFKFSTFEKHLNPARGDEQTQIKIGHSFLDGLLAGGNSLGVEFEIVEKSTGRRLTGASRTILKQTDGSIQWYNGVFNRPANEDLDRYPGMARGLYRGVERFLKEVTANWTGAAKENTSVKIGSCANSGFSNTGYKGALVWAKHYFDWKEGASTAASWRHEFKRGVDEMASRIGIDPAHVTELKAKLDAAQYPYQFVSTGFALTKSQALAATGRQTLDWDFNQIFKNKGYCDIGELILIHKGISWSGYNYVNRTEGRAGHLNALRTPYYGGQGEREAATPLRSVHGNPPPRPAPATPGAPRQRRERVPEPNLGPPPASAPSDYRVSRALYYWTKTSPSGEKKVMMTARRITKLLQFDDARLREFMQHAGPLMTRAARQKIYTALRDAGRSIG